MEGAETTNISSFLMQTMQKNTPLVGSFVSQRRVVAERSFRSRSVEAALAEVGSKIRDTELAWLFNNCLPNTLDTTVTLTVDEEGRPDTFVITGDIDAMWLRDSTNQVWPYLRFAREDAELRQLLAGVVNRQAACVRHDPYANAFTRTLDEIGHFHTDNTAMKPGLHERKYELDSLCAVMRLAHGYWRATDDLSPFDVRWVDTMTLLIDTIVTQQMGTEEDDPPAYRFERTTWTPLDTLPLGGRGHPARRCGLSKSPFRPSDDSGSLPFFVPANAMAVVTLRDLAVLLRALPASLAAASALARRADALSLEISQALSKHAVITHPVCGRIYAFEVDGFGSAYCMDDANVPSLLSLPYLGFCDPKDQIYQTTRKFVLSTQNPYYSIGKAGRGIGGPHVGMGNIWPMSIIMQALTSDDPEEIAQCLGQLKRTHGGTGFMHETFWKDDPSKFSRSWFAWANTLFGELILYVAEKHPALLGREY